MDSSLDIGFDQVREMLRLREPEREVIEITPEDRNETIRMKWTGLRLSELAAAARFLEAYTHPDNTAEQSWVSGPIQIGDANYGLSTDIWRRTRVWTEDHNTGRALYLELKLGFLRAEDFESEILWDEARLTRTVMVSAAKETELTITWQNVDRRSAQDICASLMDNVSYTSFTVDGEEFLGTWYALQSTQEQQRDGSAEVTLVLTREPDRNENSTGLGTRQPTTVYTYRHVPLSRVDTIEALFASAGTRENVSVTTDINPFTGRATVQARKVEIETDTQDNTWGSAWDTRLRRIYFWSITEAEYTAAFETYGMGTSEEQKIKEVHHRDNGNGTYDTIFTIYDVSQKSLYDHQYEFIWYENALSTQHQITRFHLTEAEANQFISEFQANTPPPEGFRYSFRVDRSFQYGDYTATVVIREQLSPVSATDITTDLTTTASALGLSGIHNPGAEAESRTFRWPDIRFSEVDDVVTRLQSPPTDWGVVSLEIRRNFEQQTADIGWTIQKEGTTETQVSIREVGAEVEQIDILLLNRPTPPDTPTTGLDAYTLVDKEIRHRGENLTDYVFRFQKKGTSTALETRHSEVGSEAESLERILYHRASDPGAPTVTGYMLVSSAVDAPGGVLPTYRYFYVKVGISAWTISISEPDQDVETREVRLINRAAEPDVPTVTGFVRVGTRVVNPDAVLSDYEYVFRRVGTGNDLVRTNNVSAEREVVEYVYPSRSSDPNPSPPTEDYVRVDAWRTNPSATLSDYHYRFAKKGTSTFAVTELATSADVGAVEYVRFDRAPGSDTTPPTIGGYQHTGTRTEGRGTPLENRVYQYRRIGSAEHVAVSRWASLDRGSRRVEFLQRTADPAYTAPEGWVIDTVATRDHGSPLVDYIYELRRIGTEALNVQTVEEGTDAEVLQVVYLQRAEEPDPDPPAETGYTLQTKSRAGAGEALGDWTYVWVKNGVSRWTIRTVGSGTTAETITDVYLNRAASPDPDGTDWLDRSAEDPAYTLMSEAVQTQGGSLADYQFIWRKKGTVGTYTSGGVETPGHLRRDIEVVRSIPESGLAAAVEAMETIDNDGKVVEAVRPTEVSPGVYDIRRAVLTLPSPIVEESYQVERFEGGGRVASWQAYTEKVSYAQARDSETGEVTDVGLLNVPRVAAYTLHVAGKQVRKIHVRNTMSWHKTRPATLEPGATGTYVNHTFRRLQHDPRGFWVEQLSEVTISEWTSTLA